MAGAEPVVPSSTAIFTGLTGVDDPYEPPAAPEVVVGAGEPVEDSVATVLAALPR